MSSASRHPANRLATAIRKLGADSGPAILLIAITAAALVLANSAWAEAYHHLFHARLGWSPVAKLDTAHLWINDGLMAVFFFVVGLEIKRELLDGALADNATRRLPVLAAAAGMALPALVFLSITGTQPPLARGWAIPAATDIAFAVGVIGLLGQRVPPALRLFLLTVAIVDDFGAVAIIAIAYTASIDTTWLAVAGGLLVTMIAMNRAGISRRLPYVLLAVLLWYAVLHSGVHATIAGVAAAATIPLKLDDQHDSPLLRMEHALVPWNAYVIVPLFGFANAGIALAGLGREALVAPLPVAVAAGLFAGKQIGILAAIWLADRTRFAPRPAGASWAQIWGMSALCGIGFTMSLFIGALAFPADPLLVDEAKLGVLGGSLASALLGYAVLRLSAAKAA